jgi:hypothetical protein
MKNIVEVRTLREQLHAKISGIEEKSGIYCWWFKEDAAKQLLQQLPLSPSELNRIQTRVIEGIEYFALYFGISSKDLLSRFKWHISQNHTDSSVKYGTISTFRQTLSALLNKNQSVSEMCINDFMDENCYLEWEYNDSPDVIEKKELSSNDKCYPLNIQDNKTVSKDVRCKLTSLRKECKL